MSESAGAEYLRDITAQFTALKTQVERALARATDEDLFRVLDRESNSLAIIMKHLAGNLRSRWTDFLTTDGEKADRNRDSEFIIDEGDTRRALFERWEAGWACVQRTLSTLTPDDLTKTVRIRGESHSVIQAINRQLAHTASHVGQIVWLVKHFNWQTWQSLTIPRGASAAVNEKLRRQFAGAESSDRGNLRPQNHH